MVRTSAPNSSAGQYIDENPATSTVGTSRIAADANMTQEELANAVEGAGLTLSGSNDEQLKQAIVAMSHIVGELVLVETEETVGILCPVVPRYDADHDIAAANYPALVTKLRAVKAKVAGVVDHSVTVSGSVVTFPNTTAGNAIVSLLYADALVAGFVPTQAVADPMVASYAAAVRRCINIAGTDYPLAANAITPGSRAVTVVGTPASGAQTASVYTYRIAGSTTTARLHRISGMVGVVAGDADGEIVGGFRRMDRGQLHGHYVRVATGSGSTLNIAGGAVNSAQDSSNFPINQALDFIVNGGGTPRMGKTTDPRTIGQYAYTWAGVYVP